MVIHYLLYITFSVVQLSISALLAAISVLLSSFEDISSILFELASDFYGVPPRASFPTEKCAILILGAQEGASVTSSTGVTYPRIPPLRCGKKRGAVILRAGLYRLCTMSKSKRRAWTPSTVREIKRRCFGEITALHLCLAAAYLTNGNFLNPVIQSYYTFGTTGKRGHDRFPGV